MVLEVGWVGGYNQAFTKHGSELIKMKKISLILLSVILPILTAGCAGESSQVSQSEPVCGISAQKAEAMKAAEDVLGEMHFGIDKSDTQAGIVRSRPLPGGQFFEFWRKDNVGCKNWAESNLHSIRRIAQVDVRQQSEGVCIECNVRVQRLNMPERMGTGFSHLAGMYTSSSQSTQQLVLEESQKGMMAWNDLGRDGLLEAKILKRIEKKIHKQRAK